MTQRRIYLEDDRKWKNKLSEKKLSDKELKITTVDQGIILPALLLPKPNPLGIHLGGVCDKDLNFVAGDRTEKDWSNITSAYPVDKKDIIQVDEDVIYGGAPIIHFGHFLTECQDRLWFPLQQMQDNMGGG